MDHGEVARLLEPIRGMLKPNPSQLEHAADWLGKFADPQPMRTAVDWYVARYKEFDFPSFREAVLRFLPASNSALEQGRRDKALKEADDMTVNAALDALPDARWDTLFQSAMAKADPSTRALLANKQSRSSPIARALVYQEMQPPGHAPSPRWK